jgi:hypothetical protein
MFNIDCPSLSQSLEMAVIENFSSLDLTTKQLSFMKQSVRCLPEISKSLSLLQMAQKIGLRFSLNRGAY